MATVFAVVFVWFAANLLILVRLAQVWRDDEARAPVVEPEVLPAFAAAPQSPAWFEAAGEPSSA
jgi:hypothetical protein